MSEYGVTPEGFVRKRLDVIMDEIHSDLSSGWNFNTRQNPESYLNVLITAFSDKIAELWELGENAYHSMYPSSAEGANLDNAAQFGGSVREGAASSYYPIHCTGADGTEIAAGTLIASKTNPPVNFVTTQTSVISRSNFNRAKIVVASVSSNTGYSVAINNILYTYTSNSNATQSGILSGIASAIKSADFKVTLEGNGVLVEANDVQSSNSLILTENLTTDNVTSIITFGSEEPGDIILPDGTITVIVKSVPGFMSCVNLSGYIAGRLRQTDTEFRKSYIDKIFNRSSRMTNSIESTILSNVQGIRSVKCYENETDEIDALGRWPHCVEVVVEGGNNLEIARQILNVKAGGINTFGDTVVQIPGEEDENITVRFNRPQYVYCWFKIIVNLSPTEQLPPDYAQIIREIIISRVGSLDVGGNVNPQRYIAEMYANVGGTDYIEIFVYSNTNGNVTPPSVFKDRSVSITQRQIAVTAETMIEVVLQ